MENNTYKTLQETKSHGKPDFHFNIYPCTIPMDFPEVSVHWHDDIELISVRKGKGIVDLDFISHEVQEGDLILIRPGQLHAIKSIANATMEYENIMLNRSFLMSYQLDACASDFFIPFMEGRYQLPAIYDRSDFCYEPLREIIARIDALCTRKDFAWQIGVKSSIYQLFYTLFARYPYEKVMIHDEKKYEAIKEILSYVEANYPNNITVEDAATQLGYSESHFMRFFKQQTNMTFISYLNDFRLAKAADALLNSSDSVLEISGNCGYDNLSLFNRHFKRKYQMTPSAFRNHINDSTESSN